METTIEMLLRDRDAIIRGGMHAIGLAHAGTDNQAVKASPSCGQPLTYLMMSGVPQ